VKSSFWKVGSDKIVQTHCMQIETCYSEFRVRPVDKVVFPSGIDHCLDKEVS
jgi:hypothetical protein